MVGFFNSAYEQYQSTAWTLTDYLAGVFADHARLEHRCGIAANHRAFARRDVHRHSMGCQRVRPYRSPLLWLADGWSAVQSGEWTQPLYWESGEAAPATMSLHGMRPIDPSAPVCHIGYFEADAFANWAGKRLATEAEWECAASGVSRDGNFCDSAFCVRPLVMGLSVAHSRCSVTCGSGRAARSLHIRGSGRARAPRPSTTESSWSATS